MNPATDPAHAIFNLRDAPFGPDHATDFLGDPIPASHDVGFDFAVGQCGPKDRRDSLVLPQRYCVIILLEGEMTISGAQANISLTQGEIALLGPTTQIDWSASAGSKWVVNAIDDAAGGPRVTKVDPDHAMEPSTAGPPELLLTPTPLCTRVELAGAPPSQWWCGLWEATAYARRPMAYRHYEMMFLYSGAITLASPSGTQTSYVAGDLIVVVPGAEVSWRSDTTVKKFWSFHLPDRGA